MNAPTLLTNVAASQSASFRLSDPLGSGDVLTTGHTDGECVAGHPTLTTPATAREPGDDDAERLEDRLSWLLRRLSLCDVRAGCSTLSAPWSIEVPSGMNSLYVVKRGSCRLIVPGHSFPFSFEEGDACLLPHGSPHYLCDPRPLPGRSYVELYPPRVRSTQDHGQAPSHDACVAGGTTELLHAHFPTRLLDRELLAGMLPDVIQIRAESNPTVRRSLPLVDFLFAEQGTAELGAAALVERVVQGLYLQIIRAFAAEQNRCRDQRSCQQEFLRAAMDPVIGNLLTQIHSQPEFPWTVRNLARLCGMARSAFTERFREVVGKPPLQYVSAYRMQRASELLRSSTLEIKEIAQQIGYETPSAFSNAFKRLVGVCPNTFRHQG